MKKILSLFVLASCLCFTSCDMLMEYIGVVSKAEGTSSYTNSEAVRAMKDALEVGIKTASTELSQPDAYFKNEAIKILLPSEAQPILNVLNQIPGGQSLVDDVVLRLNRTAEEAAKGTVDIFVDAIKEMTVIDGIKIVTGNKTAATEYLREKCYDKLVDLYRPMINTVLDKPLIGGISANNAWTNLVTPYNEIAPDINLVARLPGQDDPCPQIEVDLPTYATKKALDGLFMKIGEEEAKIRENPLQYASDMIRKVFNCVKQGIKPITG